MKLHTSSYSDACNKIDQLRKVGINAGISIDCYIWIDDNASEEALLKAEIDPTKVVSDEHAKGFFGARRIVLQSCPQCGKEMIRVGGSGKIATSNWKCPEHGIFTLSDQYRLD